MWPFINVLLVRKTHMKYSCDTLDTYYACHTCQAYYTHNMQDMYDNYHTLDTYYAYGTYDAGEADVTQIILVYLI